MSLSRRTLLKSTIASLAASPFLGASEHVSPLAIKKPHFTPKAKTVIFMPMTGGVSQVDTFDYKPVLQKNDGKSSDAIGGGTTSRLKNKGSIYASPWKFSQHGESGMWISELFSNVAKHADKLCVLNGMYTDISSHALATKFLYTGSFQFTRPSMGSWVYYGLGAPVKDLPGYTSFGKDGIASAFLPSNYQGTYLNLNGKFQNIRNPLWSKKEQAEQLDFINGLNNQSSVNIPSMVQINQSLKSDYSLAYKLQSSLPECINIDNESDQTLESYGIKSKETENFGKQCLIARKMVEKGVRFISLASGSWDHHFDIEPRLPEKCKSIDKPIAGLLADLEQRGLLDSTLIVWGGEFGRTPFSEISQGKARRGRDHNAVGYTMWMAGGGVKGGMNYGRTDEFGSQAVEDRMHIHDLHATILHLLGLDHERLVYRHGGRDFRLTDVHGEVAHKIIS